MKMTRHLPPALPQAATTDSGAEAASEVAAQATQRVEEAAVAAELVGLENAPTGDFDDSAGAPSKGRLRRKAQQWLGKLTTRGLPAPKPLPRIEPRRKPVTTETFTLPAAFGPTLLTQAVASATACAARASAGQATQGPAQYFDASLIALMLRRDTPKTETIEQLSAAPVERALDSILADEIICHMPAHLLAPITELGRVSADLFLQASPQRRLAWVAALCDALQPEYPRPWDTKTPISALLNDSPASNETKAEAIVAFLRKAPSNGYEAVTAVAISRALYQSAERQGFAVQTVPFISQANNYYVSHMLELTGRIYVKWGAEKPKHQGAGLTAFGAPSPIDASWMQPGVISAHLYQPNLSCSVVAKGLAYGNPYGVGISGSTNIFLFAASHFNTLGATRIDLMDMATAMAAVLCYSGGHSFNETYAAANMFPDAASTSLRPLATYHPGHARDLFVRQADPTNSWLQTSSFKRLAAFLLETHNPGKT